MYELCDGDLIMDGLRAVVYIRVTSTCQYPIRGLQM